MLVAPLTFIPIKFKNAKMGYQKYSYCFPITQKNKTQFSEIENRQNKIIIFKIYLNLCYTVECIAKSAFSST